MKTLCLLYLVIKPSFTGPLPRSFGLPVVPSCEKGNTHTNKSNTLQYGQEDVEQPQTSGHVA